MVVKVFLSRTKTMGRFDSRSQGFSDKEPQLFLTHFSRFFFQQYFPRCSMYGIFTHIYHRFKPNEGKYASPMGHMGFGLQDSIWNIWIYLVF